jgi:UDP:flavonoid glycosyltransferase YjiC (YdhE family)
VNGLGLGNSTRCHAVIQRLVRRNAEVRIITSGNGLWYFSSVGEVQKTYEIQSLYYGSKGGRLSIARTLASLNDFRVILKRNTELVRSVIAEWPPDVAISDSVYTYRPFKRAHIPFLALNNADVVHQSFRRFSDRPSSITAQFWCVEETDYLFHRVVADRVISPCLDWSLPEVGGNVVRVGPIVREHYRPRAPRKTLERLLVMLSGSRFGTPVAFQKTTWPFKIDVVGRAAPTGAQSNPAIAFHGKVRDNRQLVDDADLVVVNGGFSAVSESFAMRKPMIVVPVPNHAEQWVNSKTIERLGVGMSCKEADLELAIQSAAANVDRFNSAYRSIRQIPDGAEQAAQLILNT